MRAADLPREYNAWRILEGNLAERADAVALVSPAGELTFGEVAREASRVANALRRRGLRQGDVVALLLRDGPEWVTSFFGTLKAGGVALGLNTLLTPAETAFALADARARFVVADADLWAALGEQRLELAELEAAFLVGEGAADGGTPFAEWIARESDRCDAARTHREDFCTLNYSSGTTGDPKGIPHAHKDLVLCAELWGRRVLGLGPDDRTFGAAKLFFTFGLGGNLIFPWHVGASVALFPGPPRVAENVVGAIERFRPTVLYHAPTGYASILALAGLERRDLSSLRLCVSAGEALPAPLWRAWKERTGLDIVDGIGSTENFHIFLSNRPGDIRPGSSGKPFDGYELRLVDDDGREVPDGEVGNLWVKGETASLFYWRRSEQSRRTFRGEWLVTGDKYRRDADGWYWHAGRSDDMLKVGGIWVSPVEVESALCAHPAVQECAVVGREDDAGLVKPEAFVLLAPGHAASDALARELVEHCAGVMAAFKRPRWIEFVDDLPRTATGKIQRFRLRGGARA